MECESCNNIMCEECIKSLKKRDCPSCRKEQFVFKQSILARRLIGTLPADCPNGCGEKSTIGNIDQHLRKCPLRVHVCQVDKCPFEGKKDEFLQHLVESHDLVLIRQYDATSQSTIEEENKTQEVESTEMSGKFNLNFDRVGSMRNEKGKLARLGESGKYYCGGPLETDCMCCNGYCGPGNGCNCQYCMKLDMQVRMVPKGYLVNREGAMCRKGTTSNYYCGRLCMKGVAFCDGYCGPTNGPACPSCKLINTQANDRYRNLI
ncbi:e3 ubiquitin-protein ligase herc2 [Stylonychia lemnae]|uniref:E3 ubiquitin-protein ligase herc2 n=1 Tax=Stylonychia lemnae TaxID=5949 RepID=A0A078A8V4_STYLE|nr:e3 ubiquitin-protein ligase herc2 [Stylonychia lemnae]|eukprot:CDW77233.1 e3 ubiquitin-protein ligase herc2 [Stylonychia lemnae]